MNQYIISVTSSDRVGIVYSITGTLLDQGGNILELSQTVMRDYFTIILAVEFDEPQDPRQLAATIIERGKRFDLRVVVMEARDGAAPAVTPDGDRFIITVLGDDAPGNIHSISGCLAAHGVNIVDLHARVVANQFSLVMEAYLPAELAPAMIRSELARLSRDRKFEAFVQHENIFLATTEPSPVRVGNALRNQGDAGVPH
jgi:glycine cleavage system transcriptional repressor